LQIVSFFGAEGFLNVTAPTLRLEKDVLENNQLTNMRNK
jgi:hypothetical protein